VSRTRQTKIVATLGPSSEEPDVIRRLIEAGVDACRLNFSHGDHESHLKVIEIVRAVSKSLRRPVAILQDLCGPKIRISKLENGAVELIPGEIITLVELLEHSKDPKTLGISLKGVSGDVAVGEPIKLDDGAFELKVLEALPGERSIRCRVIRGGLLKERKGVNFPMTRLSVPSITEKDRADLAFGLEHDVDFVALSFVRHEDDIHELRRLIAKAGKKTKVIAKIEKGEAVERASQIILASHGIMVARGDLGVELPVYKVPAIQKELIAKAVKLNRFVITATQMLETMTKASTPTRAEVSDVANAIFDGTDAVMLSGETAAGVNPVLCVETMAEIAIEADSKICDGTIVTAQLEGEVDKETFADALCHGAHTIAADVGAHHVVAFTRTGRTPLFMSRYRPCRDVVGATDVPAIARQLAILRGVRPLDVPEVDTVRDLTVATERAIIEAGFGKKGELAVYVGGQNLTARSNINSIRLPHLAED